MSTFSALGISGCRLPLQSKQLAQPRQMHIHEAMDLAIGLGACNDRQYGEQDDMRQVVKFALGTARILDPPQQIEESGKRFHGNPCDGKLRVPFKES